MLLLRDKKNAVQGKYTHAVNVVGYITEEIVMLRMTVLNRWMRGSKL